LAEERDLVIQSFDLGVQPGPAISGVGGRAIKPVKV
jgi:hypothetical protein